MKAIADYGVSLAPYTTEKMWWGDFLKLTVAARLGLLMSWCGTETPEFDENLVLNKGGAFRAQQRLRTRRQNATETRSSSSQDW
jgi:hypothetical protein